MQHYRSKLCVEPNTLFAAIGACIKGLLEEYLFPLQQSLRNASNLLNSTQEEYVSEVASSMQICTSYECVCLLEKYIIIVCIVSSSDGHTRYVNNTITTLSPLLFTSALCGHSQSVRFNSLKSRHLLE